MEKLGCAVDSLFFNPVGNPQCLLSTGQKLEPCGTASNLEKKTKRFTIGRATPFIPRDLLQDHLQKDAALNQARNTHGSQFPANRFQGLKPETCHNGQCNDGGVLLFFLSGEGANQIASTVCYRGAGGKWYSIKKTLRSKGAGPSKQSCWPVSPSLQHSIHQLSAVWAHSSDIGGEGGAIVAARATYHVYFCTISREEEHVKFVSTAVSVFQFPVAHVAWNPHVNLEAAVILESGVVYLFDVQATGNGDPNKLVNMIAKATLASPMQQLSPKFSSHLTYVVKDSQVEPTIDEELHNQACEGPKRQELDHKWWRCEFGWLPQTLLVANSQEIFLVDFKDEQRCSIATPGPSGRENLNACSSVNDMHIIVSMAASGMRKFCSLNSRNENILAFARADYGGMYEFSIATERHLMLFDTRQPQTAILQWEHGMRQEPPSFLLMCPLSALESFVNEDELRNSSRGRAVVAASFKSGEIRVFCYGSKVSTVGLTSGSTLKKQKVKDVEWGDATYALGIPSRICLPWADVDDWRHLFSKSSGLFFERKDGLLVRKSQKGRPNIAGLVLLFDGFLEPTTNKKTFTILQLTGVGKLLVQTYESSCKLRDQAYIPRSEEKSDVEQSTRVKRLKRPKVEVLPSFLKYMHRGSILAPPHSKRFEKQESKTIDCVGSALDPGQDGSSPEIISSLENSRELGKSVDGEGLWTQLKAFVQDLNIPLSMYEVAQKVLGMELPERLAPLVAGMPSDMRAKRHRGYTFPLISPLLQTVAPSDNFAALGQEGESVNHTLSNGLEKKRKPEERVPLALLLEIFNIERPGLFPSASTTHPTQMSTDDIGNGTCSKNLTNIESRDGIEDQLNNDVTFEDGHKLLVEGCQYVQGVIEEMVTKKEPTIISLSEPTQYWQDNSNNLGESDSQLFLYSLPDQKVPPSESATGDPGPTQSLIAGGGVNDGINIVKSTPEVDVIDLKGRSCSFSNDMHKKFVAGKSGTNTRQTHPATADLKIDPALCPIKLCFTAPDAEEVWDKGELMALEDMQADFGLWQRSFPPYKNAY